MFIVVAYLIGSLVGVGTVALVIGALKPDMPTKGRRRRQFFT